MLTFRRGESPNWLLELFADDAETARVDETGTELSIVGSTLGFAPAIGWRDPAAGVAEIAISEAQSLSLLARSRHSFSIRFVRGDSVELSDPLTVVVQP